MKKIMVKSVLVFLLALCCFGVTTSTSKAADEWINNLTVHYVTVGVDSYIIDTDYNNSGCGSPGRFVIRKDTPMAKDMYAIALAALLSGKRINIYAEPGQGCHLEGRLSTWIALRRD